MNQDIRSPIFSQKRMDDSTKFRIVREVPAWGVIVLVLTVITFLSGQAITAFYGQRELSGQVKDLIIRVERLTLEISAKNITDVKHDMMLDDLRRRISDLETLETQRHRPSR